MTLVLALTLAGGAAALAVRAMVGANLERIDDPFASLSNRPAPTADPTGGTAASLPPNDADGAGGEAVDILVLGSDSRISAGDPNQWQYGAQRTDSIMLVHIAADRRHVYAMSLPRDSWVAIPGHGTAKINAAFSWGGPSLLIETVEQLTGVYIDHFVVTDFEAFQAITDELGGVDLATESGATQHLNGTEALAYVRERYSLPRGDFDRVQRQQNWMRAIMRQAIGEGTLTNPAEILRLIDLVSSSIAVDEGFTVDTMASLAYSLRHLGSGDVTFLTVPVSGTGRSPDGTQSIVNLDEPEFQALMQAVAADTVADYLSENSAAVDVLGSSVS